MWLDFMELFVAVEYFIHIMLHDLLLVHALDWVEWVDNDQAIPQVDMDFIVL